MTCRAIEFLLLESEDRALDGDDRRAVEEHLRDCPACRAFRAARLEIRDAASGFPRPDPPPALDRGTRSLCLEALAGTPAASAKVPLPVVLAAILFAALATVWLVGILGGVDPGRPLPAAAWAAIAFLAQNALVLLLSPVIFRAALTSSRRLP